MPQQSMFHDHIPAHWLGVSVSFALAEPPDTDIVVTVHGMTPAREWSTVWMGNLEGFEKDFIATMASDVASAWAWGERRDLPRAAAGVKKQARAHHRRHAY